MLRVDGVVVCCTLSLPDCSAGAGPSRLIFLLHKTWIFRCCKDCGGLWLPSRGLGCAMVYSGGGDAGCFGGLF